MEPEAPKGAAHRELVLQLTVSLGVMDSIMAAGLIQP